MIDSRLTTLLTVINTQSYTRAAAALSLTQPAVSQHVRALENEFGVRIFYKGIKGLKLTPEGKLLEKYARREAALYNNLQTDLADLKNGTQRLTIGITPTAEENVVPRVIATYCQRHPETRISILSDTMKSNYVKLRSYEIDFAIVEGGLPEQDFTCRRLDTDYMCLIVCPFHPLAGQKSVTLEELKKEKLIIRPSGTGTRKLFDNYLFSQGESMQSFHVTMEIDNVSTIKDLVRGNLGVSVIAHSACAEEQKAGKLVVLPVEGFDAVREINLVYRSDSAPEAVVEEICAIYREYALPV